MEKLWTKLGITALNPMQETAISTILKEDNTLLLSPTGSGKTLAYLLPLVQILQQDCKQIQAIVLVPTRELALQVESVWRSLGTGFKLSAFYGGHTMEVEINSLVEPPAVLVATPGRIADHFTRRTISAGRVTTILFDEFDKSLQMGFHDQIRYILTQMPARKKHVFISATQGISLPDFLQVSQVKVLDYLQKAEESADGLTLFEVRTTNKVQALLGLLGQLSPAATLIFCNQRDAVEDIAAALHRQEIPCGIFHGKMEQIDREKALIRFRNGSMRYLVTTDLAARGLDIPDVAHVIHVQLPDHQQEFTHRNGRTARMCAEGSAYILTTADAKVPYYIPEDIKQLRIQTPTRPPKAIEWTTIYISGGKKDKVSKMDIVGFFVKKGLISKEAIGRIEIQDFASYVGVRSTEVATLMQNILAQKMKGKKWKIEEAR